MMTVLADWLPDVGIMAVVFALISLLSGAYFVFWSRDIFRKTRAGQPQNNREILAAFGALLFCLLLGYSAASNTRRDHWLRVGTSRYSVATVTRSYYSRSGRKFVFTYRAGAQKHETNGECGNAPCPPAGTRRYVRFAAEAPDVCQVTAVPVPDSVTTTPALGWARLPE